MTDTLRQSLSALVDQEATEFEARKILDATKSRGDLKGYWAACQAISSTMRGEAMLGASILDRVNAELDGVTEANPIADGHDDDVAPHVTFLPTKDPLPNRFVALTGQLAVAASIAFAVVIGIKVVAPVETQPTVASSEPLEIIKFQMPVQKETVSVDGMTNAQEVIKRRPVARILTEQDMKQLVSNRLSSYLVRHAENTAVIGGTSVLPLARIMGRDEPIE
jgi:sigma-E factor negative regulatory protein RseA